MSKTTREVMTPGLPAEGALDACSVIGADDHVEEALRAMLERGSARLAVVDGHEIIGTVTQGELAISIEDARAWSALCS